MDFNKDRYEEILSNLLQEEIILVKELKGGLNSKVWMIEGKKKYVVKFYFNKNDNRNKLENEFLSLQFLWSRGIRNISRPIAYDQLNNCGVYSYVEGRKLPAEDSSNHIITMVNFLKRLK